MMSFWSDVVKDVSNFILAGQGDQAAQVQSAGTAQAAGAAVNSAAGDVGAAVTTVEGIWTELTDVRLWRSLGWLLLGLILMFLGVLWWIGPAAARRSPAAVARGVVA